MKVLVATNNKGKLKEFKKILSEFNFIIYSLDDLNIKIKPNETGKSFFENAFIKAKEFYKVAKMPVIADDSGLCVKALNDMPGIKSARYFSNNASDDENVEFLLSKMKDKEDKRAYFVCEIVFYINENKYLNSRGECKGEILSQKKGENGFGYDPIFSVNGKSFAQMNEEEKNKISHRSKAIENLLKKLRNLDIRF